MQTRPQLWRPSKRTPRGGFTTLFIVLSLPALVMAFLLVLNASVTYLARQQAEAAIEAGAEDVVVDADKSIEVLTEPTDFESVRDAMRGAGFEPESAELTMRASTSAELAGWIAIRSGA